MEMMQSFVFQADSDIVKKNYNNNNNYIIECDENLEKKYCIIYFSSNNIYDPNSEVEFNKQIVNKNRFEWYGTRIKYGYKHIFLRDIIKQWYLTGINSKLNNPEKVLNFLKVETEGFKIITLGSSAGGFAAVVYGQLLNAERIFSFNGQFEVFSLLDSSSADIDPIIFRNKGNNELLRFYDCRNFIIKPETIYYFFSSRSPIDLQQKQYVQDVGINFIEFKTSHHGIPFLKSNLPVVLNLSQNKLNSLCDKSFNPVIFSFKMIGFFKTLQTLTELSFLLFKRYIRKLR